MPVPHYLQLLYTSKMVSPPPKVLKYLVNKRRRNSPSQVCACACSHDPTVAVNFMEFSAVHPTNVTRFGHPKEDTQEMEKAVSIVGDGTAARSLPVLIMPFDADKCRRRSYQAKWSLKTSLRLPAVRLLPTLPKITVRVVSASTTSTLFR
jgi:hypothetical protein